MRAKDLKSKMPQLWNAVESGVFEDLRLQKKIHKFSMTEKAGRTIAHNAAFMAVSFLWSKIGKKS